MESTALLKNDSNNKKPKVLNYLSFIKFIAMIIIIKWHIAYWKKRPIDYGARMCEILFVSSGFLVGYNHYDRKMICNYESSFKYTFKKFKTFYPLLFINTLYGYLITKNKKYNINEIILLLSILFLIKSWSRFGHLATFYNGHSWFLSSLLFSYFLVPLLIQGLKTIKISIFYLLIICFIRILCEEIINNGAFNMFDIDFHRGPIIRLLEFYMGMLLIPLFYKSKSYLDKHKNKKWFKMIFTLIEIVSVIILYFIMLRFDRVMYRCYFTIIFCSFIFIISFDFGYISDLFSNKFMIKITCCQMEMYIIQRTINETFYKIINKKKFELSFDSEINFLIKLFIIFITAYLYRILLRDIFSKLFIFAYSN